MIRGNLATRPFYNERAVHLWLLVAALVVVAATLFNVVQMLRYSRSDTELARQAANDEARATELRAEAARLRATVDAKQIERASLEARQANELIDRRTFSWTALLNEFEATLPPDVRITSFRPRIDPKRGNVVTHYARRPQRGRRAAVHGEPREDRGVSANRTRPRSAPTSTDSSRP